MKRYVCEIDPNCEEAATRRECGHMACDGHCDADGCCIPCAPIVESYEQVAEEVVD